MEISVLFSLHLNKKAIGNEGYYSRNFKFVETDDPRIIAKIVKNFVSSPIRWELGRRKKQYFKAANWIGLDFDSGTPLIDMLDAFKAYTHVIGTTKHHQLPKGDKGVHDRFRVFLKMPLTITDCKTYEEVVRFYVAAYKADWQAIDGARKFNPCREIISVVEGETIALRKKKKYSDTVQARTPIEGIPRWILQLLTMGVGYGVSRNTTCFKIAVHLKKAGYSESQIVDMLMNSAVPIGPEVRSEVEAAVRSGMRA